MAPPDGNQAGFYYVAYFEGLCYAVSAIQRARSCWSQAVGPPFFDGGEHFFAPILWEGGDDMVTYAELFQYTLVLIGIVSLAIQLWKK